MPVALATMRTLLLEMSAMYMLPSASTATSVGESSLAPLAVAAPPSPPSPLENRVPATMLTVPADRLSRMTAWQYLEE